MLRINKIILPIHLSQTQVNIDNKLEGFYNYYFNSIPRSSDGEYKLYFTITHDSKLTWNNNIASSIFSSCKLNELDQNNNEINGSEIDMINQNNQSYSFSNIDFKTFLIKFRYK